MGQHVLIVAWIASSGYAQYPQITMQTFDSLARCEIAAEKVKAKFPGVSVQCVLK